MADVLQSLSFSTMWNYMRSGDGAELLRQILALGFRRVELNYRIAEATLRAMEPLLETGAIRVSSLHNVFPHTDDPAFDTDSLLLSYEDPELRKRSIALTRRTVDYAQRLGAEAVVIHPGAVPELPFRPYDSLLKEMYRKGLKDTPEYRRLFQEMKDYRERERPAYIRRIKESLSEICAYIAKKNYRVSLGIENRSMCHQIPDFEEARYLLDELRGLPVYFWYDIGHGLAMEALGIYDSLSEARKLQERILGVHIHDTVGVEDHWTPYIHSDRLDDFIEIIRAAPIKVLELGAKNPADEIRRGVAVLCRKIGGGEA
ncbi:sugar phosphate isomerase/epimerase [Hydrogenispora ethanolica]|jgi:sugar phosphate isomerase/epimerase|uniref:Sugar phosphate isomerase/epimerase n=1 Tax=Hydrogenispora ethanolica TaxID=1082276 RepID=A0A4R1RRJ5_HYDET|nr:TIM barrel protein [Hydrogenispora ethanolica]TCL68572.1 sugar phosphate isomerase/epimerase [Hydrogenispora ethanolica]